MNPRTRRVIIILALVILAVSLTAGAQPLKVHRLGILSGETPPADKGPSRWHEAFQQGLRELGWIEGQNIALEYRFAAGQFERFPQLAAELIELKVDVIVASLTLAIQAAMRATTTIPIVMAGPGDPVSTGLVRSLRRPGGNVTGLSAMATELMGKRLELLREALPKARGLVVLMDPDNSAMRVRVRELESELARFGWRMTPAEVWGLNDLESTLASLGKHRGKALLVTYDPLSLVHRRRIVEAAAHHQLPAIYELRDFVDEGGLMSYGPSRPEMYRRAASYVDKIFKGTKPGDLPVEQPMAFELVINLKTAKALDLAFPPSLLMIANEVIK